MTMLPSEVYKQAFWMGRLGSASPKRSVLYSSSPAIHEFGAYARLSKKDRKACHEKLATSFKDKKGKARYTGVKKKLKKSQNPDSITIVC